MNWINNWLDRITMYRLVIYYLSAVLLAAVGLGMIRSLPYSPLSIISSSLVILVICFITNAVFARTNKAQTNVESTYITALILACIFAPPQHASDLPVLIWASILAISSKYIFSINHKHIFNPAAIAAVIVGIGLKVTPIWWVGTPLLAPVVFIGGLLVVHKIRRFDVVISFAITTLIIVTGYGIAHGHGIIHLLNQQLLQSSLFFFGLVMLTEPLTLPPMRFWRIIYGAFVGLLFSPNIHLGSVYFTPELSLVVGNVFAYIVSPKIVSKLRLIEKIQISPTCFDFVFERPKRLRFLPGQYLEWTLPHRPMDARGSRRYFTIASAPTENKVRIGVKFASKSSSYKKALLAMNPNDSITVANLAGEFVLPKNQRQKVALIAGGIGITPYRSMVMHLLQTGQRRPLTLFYSAVSSNEIVYGDIFNRAQESLGLKAIYCATSTAPQGWSGHRGPIDQALIRQTLPDYLDHIFYISGSHAMVTGISDLLKSMDIPEHHIKTDYFPGLA